MTRCDATCWRHWLECYLLIRKASVFSYRTVALRVVVAIVVVVFLLVVVGAAGTAAAAKRQSWVLLDLALPPQTFLELHSVASLPLLYLRCWLSYVVLVLVVVFRVVVVVETVVMAVTVAVVVVAVIAVAFVVVVVFVLALVVAFVVAIAAVVAVDLGRDVVIESSVGAFGVGDVSSAVGRFAIEISLSVLFPSHRPFLCALSPSLPFPSLFLFPFREGRHLPATGYI